jgi:quercetin dioxygenase-like cupin family protein
MTASAEPAAALHRGISDLPWIDLRDGSELQLLRVDLDANLWIGRQRFQPGTRLLRHRHTGPLAVVTFRGRWRYLEYPEVNTAGSYLFEPAGSTHTFEVPADNDETTEIWFSIEGCNLNLDADDQIVSVYDAASILRYYRRECARLGVRDPAVIGA